MNIGGISIDIFCYLCVDSCRGQLVFSNHDQDTKHSHDESIVTNPLPLFEERFSPAQTMRQVVVIVTTFAPATD